MATYNVEYSFPDSGSVPVYHFDVNSGSGAEIYLVTDGNNMNLTTAQMDTVATAAKNALAAISGVTSVTQKKISWSEV